MAMKCLSCGGVYEPIGADKVPYVHVCAPVLCVAVTRAGVAGLTPLALVKPDDVVQVQRGAAVIGVPFKDVQVDDHRIGDVHLERSNKRDENVVRVDFVNSVKVPVIKAVGAGASTVIAVAPAPPALLDAI